MGILFFGNNWAAWKIMEWLQEQKEKLAGIVLHPPGKQRYGKEIVSTASVDPACIFQASELRKPETVEAISRLRPEIGISVYFGYILRREVLSLMPAGCVNVHPALLPYSRGAYPNVWSIVEGGPAGVTIHYMDDGVDTGDIVAQREVHIEPIDTGERLYRKLETNAVDLFKKTWPLIRSGQAPRFPQDRESGTYHRVRDVELIDKIEVDQMYTARKLIDILRARTFPPYPGAYFWHSGRKVYVRLELLYEEELERDPPDGQHGN